MSVIVQRKSVASNSVPENKWIDAKLEDILPLKYGKARSEEFGYPRSATSTYGSNGAFGFYDRALTTKPAIIIGRKGAAGSVHYAAEPCWPIDTSFYTEGSDRTHLPFFRYLLESLQLVRLDRSTAIPSLSRDDYNSKIVRIPEFVSDQRKIVAEIEKQFTRLDAGVTALKRVQANLKRYRASVLKAACEGRLVPTEHELARKEGRSYETGEQLLARILADRRQKWQGRGKYKEPTVPDVTKLPPLPKGWAWATIEQISASIVDCPHSTPKWRTHGRVCVRTTEFRPGFLDLSKVRFVSEEAFQERIARLEPHAGDILYSREGGILGIACQVPQGSSLCLGQRMMLIRPSAYVVSRFVMDWLNAPFIQNLVKSLISGSAAPHLNVGEIRQFSIPLAPLSEQKRIVAEVERRLSIIDELETVVTANLQRATRLRQSVLQKAFAGASAHE